MHKWNFIIARNQKQLYDECVFFLFSAGTSCGIKFTNARKMENDECRVNGKWRIVNGETEVNPHKKPRNTPKQYPIVCIHPMNKR